MKTGVELAVVTVADLGGEEIEPAAVDLFRAWGIGRKGKDDGVLILLAWRERRVRIEVGYGLEGILPDGLCGSIIRREMAPGLAAGRVGPGLLRGASAVAGVIAKDRGVTITGAVAPESGEEGERGPPHAIFLTALFVALILSAVFRAASRWRGWMWTGRGGWWDGRGPGGYGGMFGGFGGMGGGFGGGGGGFGGFGGGRSGGGGASGGF